MTRLVPLLLGGLMATMMVAILHPMPDGWPGARAAVAFVGAHVALLPILAGLALLWPRLRWPLLAHRPSLRHLGVMAVGWVGTAPALHLVLHGSLA